MPRVTMDNEFCTLTALLASAFADSGLPAESVAEVLEEQGEAVAADMVAVLRKRVEIMTGLVRRKWKVADRSQAPEAVLKATGRAVYTNDEVVAVMPRGEGEEGETAFFKLDLSERGGWISDEDLDQEFELRHLEPELPDNLAAINRADPAFADEHPNATHWKDANGQWCYAAFLRWPGEHVVSVSRNDNKWDDDWWFAGRRKSTRHSATSTS